MCLLAEALSRLALVTGGMLDRGEGREEVEERMCSKNKKPTNQMLFSCSLLYRSTKINWGKGKKMGHRRANSACSMQKHLKLTNCSSGLCPSCHSQLLQEVEIPISYRVAPLGFQGMSVNILLLGTDAKEEDK